MRVITGSFKGRILNTVPSPYTRPTSNKIKEAIFHVIGPYFEGGTGLDLYAGSGALGIEAISRGIDSITFIDHSKEAIETIRKNIRLLQLGGRVHIYRNDALRALDILGKRRQQFDVIFIDPPYRSKDYSKVLKLIEQLQLAKDNCYIYIEHAPETPFDYNQAYYESFFMRQYSKEIAVTILQVIK